MITIGTGWGLRGLRAAKPRPPRRERCRYELGCVEPAVVMAPDRLYAAVVPCCARHGLGGGTDE